MSSRARSAPSSPPSPPTPATPPTCSSQVSRDRSSACFPRGRTADDSRGFPLDCSSAPRGRRAMSRIRGDSYQVTDEEKRRFREEGYVHLHGLLAPAEV